MLAEHLLLITQEGHRVFSRIKMLSEDSAGTYTNTYINRFIIIICPEVDKHQYILGQHEVLVLSRTAIGDRIGNCKNLSLAVE